MKENYPKRIISASAYLFVLREVLARCGKGRSEVEGGFTHVVKEKTEGSKSSVDGWDHMAGACHGQLLLLESHILGYVLSRLENSYSVGLV